MHTRSNTILIYEQARPFEEKPGLSRRPGEHSVDALSPDTTTTTLEPVMATERTSSCDVAFEFLKILMPKAPGDGATGPGRTATA